MSVAPSTIDLDSDNESEHDYYIRVHNDTGSEADIDDEVIIVRDILDLTSEHSGAGDDPDERNWMRWVHNMTSISLNQTVMQELSNSLQNYHQEDSDDSSSTPMTSEDDETWHSVIDRGILLQIEPLLYIDESCYNTLDQLQTKAVDGVLNVLGALGIRIAAPLFARFTTEELHALFRFVVRRMREDDSRDDDRADAYSLDPFQHIHPLLIYRFLDSHSKIHLPSIYDSIIAERTVGAIPRNPYTNSPLSDLEQQNIIRRYYEVAFFFKAVIEID